MTIKRLKQIYRISMFRIITIQFDISKTFISEAKSKDANYFMNLYLYLCLFVPYHIKHYKVTTMGLLGPFIVRDYKEFKLCSHVLWHLYKYYSKDEFNKEYMKPFIYFDDEDEFKQFADNYKHINLCLSNLIVSSAISEDNKATTIIYNSPAPDYKESREIDNKIRTKFLAFASVLITIKRLLNGGV